jgi:hypothetical protein
MKGPRFNHEKAKKNLEVRQQKAAHAYHGRVGDTEAQLSPRARQDRREELWKECLAEKGGPVTNFEIRRWVAERYPQYGFLFLR